MKIVTLTFALATTLAPLAASATETAVIGGGPAAPPAGSAGPDAGITAAPGQGPPPATATAEAAKLGHVPRATPPGAQPFSRNKRDCTKTVCANSNGG